MMEQSVDPDATERRSPLRNNEGSPRGAHRARPRDFPRFNSSFASRRKAFHEGALGALVI